MADFWNAAVLWRYYRPCAMPDVHNVVFFKYSIVRFSFLYSSSSILEYSLFILFQQLSNSICVVHILRFSKCFVSCTVLLLSIFMLRLFFCWVRFTENLRLEVLGNRLFNVGRGRYSIQTVLPFVLICLFLWTQLCHYLVLNSSSNGKLTWFSLGLALKIHCI